MLPFLGQSLTLTLPILISGIGLIIILKNDYLSPLNKPVDGGCKLWNNYIFGPNKTWRGVAVHSVLAIIASALLGASVGALPTYVHPVFAGHPFLIGGAYAASYIAGELCNSFIKRRVGIESGKGTNVLQSVLDNVDGMIVVAVVLVAIFAVPVASVATALIMGFVLHKFTDVVMKRLRLK